MPMINSDVKYTVIKKCAFLSAAKQNSCRKHLARVLASGRLCLVLNQSQKLKAHILQRRSQSGSFSAEVTKCNQLKAGLWVCVLSSRCCFYQQTQGLASSKLLVNTEEAYWTFSFKVRPKASFPIIKREGRRAQSHIFTDVNDQAYHCQTKARTCWFCFFLRG